MKRIIKKGFGYLIILFILLAITLSPMIVIDKQLQENEQQEEVPQQNAVQNNDLLAKAKVKKTTKKKTTKKKKTVTKQAKKYFKLKVKKAKVKLNAKGTVVEMKEYAHQLVLSNGWTEYDYECLVKIVNHESSWNVTSINKSSGACGLPQALPCSKMASAGSDYRTNYKTQLKRLMGYIKGRYKTPSKAWAFWQKHHWY